MWRVLSVQQIIQLHRLFCTLCLGKLCGDELSPPAHTRQIVLPALRKECAGLRNFAIPDCLRIIRRQEFSVLCKNTLIIAEHFTVHRRCKTVLLNGQPALDRI